jgi:HD-like signal output (HDOD) protein
MDAVMSKTYSSSTPENVLEKIRADTNLPSLGSSLAKVIQITSDGEDSVAQLAHFVLADVGLTQKIIRLANTIHYRSAGNPMVTTVSRAIFLLGFNTIKSSALALLLVDGFHNKSQARMVRKELVHALCASIIARELVGRGRFLDAEEAVVASLFKNLGRLLLAYFDPSLYERIQEAHTQDPSLSAENDPALVGFSFARFTQKVLHEWIMPESIIQAQQPLNSGELKLNVGRLDWLRSVASFSDELATVLMPTHGAAPTERAQDARRMLFRRFHKVLELSQDSFEDILIKVSQETKQFAANIGLLVDEPSSLVEVKPNILDAEFLLQTLTSVPSEDMQRHPSGKPINARDLLLAGMQDIMQMANTAEVKLNDLILLTLETLYGAMGFRFATICMRDPKLKRYSARIAVGELYQERQRVFMFEEMSDQSLFHLALENNADLMISNVLVPKIQILLPSWYKKAFPDARSFIVLPLVVQNNPIGLFYADRVTTAEEGVPPDETALIKTIKNQLLLALTRR